MQLWYMGAVVYWGNGCLSWHVSVSIYEEATYVGWSHRTGADLPAQHRNVNISCNMSNVSFLRYIYRFCFKSCTTTLYRLLPKFIFMPSIYVMYTTKPPSINNKTIFFMCTFLLWLNFVNIWHFGTLNNIPYI